MLDVGDFVIQMTAVPHDEAEQNKIAATRYEGGLWQSGQPVWAL